MGGHHQDLKYSHIPIGKSLVLAGSELSDKCALGDQDIFVTLQLAPQHQHHLLTDRECHLDLSPVKIQAWPASSVLSPSRTRPKPLHPSPRSWPIHTPFVRRTPGEDARRRKGTAKRWPMARLTGSSPHPEKLCRALWAKHSAVIKTRSHPSQDRSLRWSISC